MLGVPDGTEITVQPLDEDRLGYYSAASRQIVLSRSVLESGTAQETMDTIAHEAFHVQQAYVVENIDWDDAATQAAYYDQARRWLRNYQNGYVSGEEDILGYYFQPVEVDARAYAEETERPAGADRQRAAERDLTRKAERPAEGERSAFSNIPETPVLRYNGAGWTGLPCRTRTGNERSSCLWKKRCAAARIRSWKPASGRFCRTRPSAVR